MKIESGKQKKKKKNSNLIFIIIASGVLLFGILLGIFLSGKSSGTQPLGNNLGEQQRQQVQEMASQLVGNILDNQNNFNQLTTNPDGTRRNIDDIEDVFLSNNLNQSPQSPTAPAPSQITGSLSPIIIEQSWYELRTFIIACLQNPDQSLLENVRLRVRNDIEKWIRWELEKIKGDYNKLLEEYLKVIQELKTIKELFDKYSQIRTNLVINKVSRKDELIAKGYSEQDIEQLKGWNLLEQKFPNLYDEKRVGVTNTLSVMSRDTGWGQREIVGGSSSELLLFLKPNRSNETIINFPPNKISDAQQKSVQEIIQNLLKNSSRLGQEIKQYDIYILRLRTGNTTYTGPSSGVAHYLALYSALHQTPLPRNLASTATIEENKVGAIGGLKYKLEAAIKKEKTINNFILSIDNKRCEWAPEQSWEHMSSDITNQIKQVHFISQVDQIEIALQEILKEPNRKIVHSCGKDEVPDKKPEKPEPRGPPEKPEQPSPEITSEQLLSLITELSIRGKGEIQDPDFWEKLQAAYAKNVNYQEAVNSVLQLQKEYQGKIIELSKPRNPGQSKKLRKFTACFDGKILKEEEVEENDKMICEVCHQQFEEGYSVFMCSKPWWCPKCVPDSVKKGEAEVKEERIGGKETNNPTPEEIEKEKKQILQEYRNKFKEISASVVNLTNEILTNLTKNGYALAEIKWTGELHAPSLTAEPAISFSLTRKK